MASRDPFAVRICCFPLPRKSPDTASCVAEGCLTVKAYKDKVEKLVMLAEGGRSPRLREDVRPTNSSYVANFALPMVVR